MRKSEGRAGWQPGQRVRVTSGPFEKFVGVVRAVDNERRRLRVAASFFGRETLLELGFEQVKQV